MWTIYRPRNFSVFRLKTCFRFWGNIDQRNNQSRWFTNNHQYCFLLIRSHYADRVTDCADDSNDFVAKLKQTIHWNQWRSHKFLHAAKEKLGLHHVMVGEEGRRPRIKGRYVFLTSVGAYGSPTAWLPTRLISESNVNYMHPFNIENYSYICPVKTMFSCLLKHFYQQSEDYFVWMLKDEIKYVKYWNMLRCFVDSETTNKWWGSGFQLNCAHKRTWLLSFEGKGWITLSEALAV